MPAKTHPMELELAQNRIKQLEKELQIAKGDILARDQSAKEALEQHEKTVSFHKGVIDGLERALAKMTMLSWTMHR